MIKQDTFTEIALGNGDVGVFVGYNYKTNSSAICFANLIENKERKAGDKYNITDVVNYDDVKKRIKCPVVISIDNMEALIVLKEALNKVEKQLKENNERVEEMPRFIVKRDYLKVLSKFKTVNPSPDKVITCLTNYQKDGKLDRDIVVNCNNQIKDGYVAFLVANYLGLNELNVIAPKGIVGNFPTGSLKFTSENVHVHLEYKIEEKKFLLFIEGVNVAELDTVAQAAYFLSTTFDRQGLFIPKFVFDNSKFTKMLESKMKDK